MINNNYPRIIKVFNDSDLISGSCSRCQKIVDEFYFYINVYFKFCSYRCFFNFFYEYLQNFDDDFIKVYCMNNYSFFKKLPYEKQNWIFQLTKILMEDFKKYGKEKKDC